MLSIKNLTVDINEKHVLKDIGLDVDKGEVVAILGPNGHGKSTIFKSIFNHYKVNKINGQIYFNDKEITHLSPDAISKLGVFLAPQISEEIQGVTMLDFLKLTINSHRQEPISIVELYRKTEAYLKDLNLDRTVLERHVNLGFSGGEKKKSEILQMLLLDPQLLLLDEIDSGLDVDSLNIIIKKIKEWKTPEKSIIITSHNEKILSFIKPDKVVVVIDGQIKKVGSYELVEKINKEGYGWINE